MASTQRKTDDFTRLVGLLGWSAEAWPSPAIYNAAFQARGLDWRCVPLPVREGQLRQALLGLQALGFAGAELSAPFQREGLEYVEAFSPAAETIGAARHVSVGEHGLLVGENLLWLGFLATLRAMVPALSGLCPLVIGAGDTARSIVYALTREGLPLTILDERIERAVDLVRHLRHAMDEHSFSVYRWPQDLERVAAGANLIVNATSVGMWPDVERSPWPDEVPFPPGALALDLVFWPGETRFLRQARSSGAWTVGGFPLLVYEAALAFEKWTGQLAPMEVMWQAAGEALAQRTSRDVPWPESVWESSLPLPQLT